MATEDDAIEEEQVEDSSSEQDVLGVSDEDFLNMAPPNEEAVPETTDEVEDEATEEVDDTVADTGTNSADSVEDTESEEDSDNEPDIEAKDNKEDTEETSAIDYKAQYEALLTPFRANGKDMQVSSVEDAITLMQQGANYNKKMAGLKPNLKLMKMLENNELLDEEKLSYLIDLNKKNPEAIQKFIKDSGIDPLDIDTEKDTEYSPNSYTVDDKEVELDGVLDEIRDTQSFNETIDIISNKWDASSKKVLLDQPDIIGVINAHVGSGIYGQISSVVENERMLGRLKGLSDLEAYKQVGDVIQAVGGFNGQTPANVQTDTEVVNKVQDDPKLKDRKRAASSTKRTTKKAPTEFNPLSMSDEEFEKIAGSQFI